MATFLAALVEANGMKGCDYAEAFAGGAGAALKLLYAGVVDRLILNDADPAIHDFWFAVLGCTDAFLRLMWERPVTVEEWRRQHAIWKTPEDHSLVERGFATFFLNRANRSGILRGRPIGGFDQSGNYPITARYDKTRLTERIKRLAGWRHRISVTSLDALDFLNSITKRRSKPFLFLDPPYVAQGRHLYLNAYQEKHHRALATWLRTHEGIPWALTYDDTPLVRKLYAWGKMDTMSLRYSAQVKRTAKELLILPHRMLVPGKPTRPLRYADAPASARPETIPTSPKARFSHLTATPPS